MHTMDAIQLGWVLKSHRTAEIIFVPEVDAKQPRRQHALSLPCTFRCTMKFGSKSADKPSDQSNMDCQGSNIARDSSLPDAHVFIILYDGVCGLCNRLNQFVVRHDRGGLFQFASLQSPLAGRILSRHGASLTLDTVCVVLNHNQPEESLRLRSDAVVFVLAHLGGIWRLAGIFLGWLPRWFRDRAYDIIARNRYGVFGRSEACIMPSAEIRSRFLDL